MNGALRAAGLPAALMLLPRAAADGGTDGGATGADVTGNAANADAAARGGVSAEPLRIAVFASGSGSNFEAVAEAARAGRIRGSIELIVCDKPQAFVLERAKRLEIEAFAFRPKDYESREACEREIVARLQEKRIDLIVMAGYMRLVTQVLVEPFYGRMINIHPALLPAFPGLNAVEQALEHGAKVTGPTVHFVDGGMDTGPIIAQTAVEIAEGDTAETLSSRIHKAEHELLPRVVSWIADGRVSLDGRIVRIST